MFCTDTLKSRTSTAALSQEPQGARGATAFFRLLMKCADVTPDKDATHMEKRRSTFEQSQCRMQRLNFFVVRQSSEWNTVMQIGRGAAIVWWRYGPDTAGLRTNPTLCQSFGSQSSSPTFLPLCSFTVFREIRREKQLGRIGAFFFYVLKLCQSTSRTCCSQIKIASS